MDLLQRLLGLSAATGPLRLDRIFLVQPWPVLASIAVIVALAMLVIAYYHRDGTRPSWVWKGVMAGLRLAAMGILLFMIWQPMLRGERIDVTPSVVAVLIDESGSMAIKDRWQDRKLREELIRALSDGTAGGVSRSEALFKLVNRDGSSALKALLERHAVRVYRFGSEARGADLPRGGLDRPAAGGETLPLRPAAPRDEQTRLGDVLDAVREDLTGQPLAGVVLLSDGGQNAGEDPVAAARRLAEMGVPIHTVGFGDPTPPHDLAVVSLLTDEVVRKGDEVVVSVSLRQRGYSGKTASLTLRLGDRVLRRLPVRLGPEGRKQDVTLSFTPNEAGARTLVASLDTLPGEMTTANNRKAWPVRIIDKRLKILYVEGYPRWEYRYLKNAILRDRTTLFSCMLVEADPSLGGEGNQPIYGFPRERRALFEYDILILGDIPREFFSQQDLKNIREFVEERGGSLITMAGELFLPWQYRGTDLDAVLPIPAPPSRKEILFREPFQLALTEAGARHPMMLLVPDVEANRNVWHGLPGMYWCGVAERAKPGATVLAEHPTQRGLDGKIPLLAVQQVGEGNSFMTMVDSTWQWRYRVGDKHFYRFWGQVIRTMTPHDLPGANRFTRLTADRTTLNLGEKVVIRARLLSPSYKPIRAREVQAEMERTDGQRFPVRLEPVPGAAGIFAGEWQPTLPGAYKALLRGEGGERRESITNVVVEEASLEQENPEQNRALLRRLSAITGGQYLSWADYSRLPNLIRDRSQEVSTRVEHTLWDAPLPISLFLLLLVAEWLLRKRKGLL